MVCGRLSAVGNKMACCGKIYISNVTFRMFFIPTSRMNSATVLANTEPRNCFLCSPFDIETSLKVSI